MAPRLTIPSTRFPPVPFLDPPPRRVGPDERRLIRMALAGGTPSLPTDWPDLSPLIEAVARALEARENAA
jgi:hypothetical protein